jgi:hypothetical protein
MAMKKNQYFSQYSQPMETLSEKKAQQNSINFSHR